MSFLAPLYFLGALAVAGPIIFHLIRRQPKGEVEFSSLMFLEATPPRITRRSRLENWPLLLLRCLAICMLAFAFARPFLPTAQSDQIDGVKQALILLVDRSASMQRAGLWDQVKRAVDQVTNESESETLISVIAFDSQPEMLLSLEESGKLLAESRVGAAMDAVAKLSPSWQSTDIGTAIRYAADQAAQLDLGDAESSRQTADSASATIETRIVLLSDLQSGAAIESVQGYEWPDRVWLDIQEIKPQTRGNVSLRVLPQVAQQGPESANEPGERMSVRVGLSQAADGNASTFRLRFDKQSTDADVVQVPPGQTRFIRLQLPDQSTGDAEPSNRLKTVLRVYGDADDFDNQFFFIAPKRIDQTVRFLVRDEDRQAKDPRETLRFFTSQVPWSDATRRVELKTRTKSESASDELESDNTPLLITGGDLLDSPLTESLQEYIRTGGRVLIVLDKPIEGDAFNSLATLLDSPELSSEPSSGDDYRLISSVDFKSALIAPLSEPGVNDFSNIRIWKHQRLANLDDSIQQTLRLDNGAPFLLRKDVVGNDDQAYGKLWVLTSGWQPSQSQFALSTKFVPILLGMLGENHQLAPESLVVGQPFGDDQVADEPGFITTDDGVLAINLAPSESQTHPIDPDRFSQLGAVVSTPEIRHQDATAKRALRDVELESRQGWWRWLILGTLGLVAIETVISARRQSLEDES